MFQSFIVKSGCSEEQPLFYSLAPPLGRKSDLLGILNYPLTGDILVVNVFGTIYCRFRLNFAH